MIFFFFSNLSSLVGGKSAGSFLNVSLVRRLSVDNLFSGIISLWPFIVAMLILLLSILWYQSLKIMERNKTQGGSKYRSRNQSAIYKGTIALFVLIVIAIPFFISRYGQEYINTEVTIPENLVETVITVHGMDCTDCEGLVNRNLKNIKGIEKATATIQREEVAVVYDKTKTSLEEIARIIESLGFTVVRE
jgi:copper chaperone CopZ